MRYASGKVRFFWVSDVLRGHIDWLRCTRACTKSVEELLLEIGRVCASDEWCMLALHVTKRDTRPELSRAGFCAGLSIVLADTHVDEVKVGRTWVQNNVLAIDSERCILYIDEVIEACHAGTGVNLTRDEMAELLTRTFDVRIPTSTRTRVPKLVLLRGQCENQAAAMSRNMDALIGDMSFMGGICADAAVHFTAKNMYSPRTGFMVIPEVDSAGYPTPRFERYWAALTFYHPTLQGTLEDVSEKYAALSRLLNDVGYAVFCTMRWIRGTPHLRWLAFHMVGLFTISAEAARRDFRLGLSLARYAPWWGNPLELPMPFASNTEAQRLWSAKWASTIESGTLLIADRPALADVPDFMTGFGSKVRAGRRPKVAYLSGATDSDVGALPPSRKRGRTLLAAAVGATDEVEARDAEMAALPSRSESGKRRRVAVEDAGEGEEKLHEQREMRVMDGDDDDGGESDDDEEDDIDAVSQSIVNDLASFSRSDASGEESGTAGDKDMESEGHMSVVDVASVQKHIQTKIEEVALREKEEKKERPAIVDVPLDGELPVCPPSSPEAKPEEAALPTAADPVAPLPPVTDGVLHEYVDRAVDTVTATEPEARKVQIRHMAARANLPRITQMLQYPDMLRMDAAEIPPDVLRAIWVKLVPHLQQKYVVEVTHDALADGDGYSLSTERMKRMASGVYSVPGGLRRINVTGCSEDADEGEGDSDSLDYTRSLLSILCTFASHTPSRRAEEMQRLVIQSCSLVDPSAVHAPSGITSAWSRISSHDLFPSAAERQKDKEKRILVTVTCMYGVNSRGSCLFVNHSSDYDDVKRRLADVERRLSIGRRGTDAIFLSSAPRATKKRREEINGRVLDVLRRAAPEGTLVSFNISIRASMHRDRADALRRDFMPTLDSVLTPVQLNTSQIAACV